jgi:RIO kinase 2
VLKLTRLGRNSFRSIKKNREYIQNRTSYNYLYLSRLSSVREFLFMQLLHKNGFPVPTPIDTNRHGILMSLIDGDAFSKIQRISTQKEIKSLFETCLNTLVKFASYGLIHGDYNEFNLMVN